MIKEKKGNENATSHIITVISMTVKRGNAVSIMGTLGPLRKLEDLFEVISPDKEKSYFSSIISTFSDNHCF